MEELELLRQVYGQSIATNRVNWYYERKDQDVATTEIYTVLKGAQTSHQEVQIITSLLHKITNPKINSDKKVDLQLFGDGRHKVTNSGQEWVHVGEIY